MNNSLLISLFCCVGGLVGSVVLAGLAMSSHLLLALVVDLLGRLFQRDDDNQIL
jgi:hypothetical protein